MTTPSEYLEAMVEQAVYNSCHIECARPGCEGYSCARCIILSGFDAAQVPALIEALVRIAANTEVGTCACPSPRGKYREDDMQQHRGWCAVTLARTTLARLLPEEPA